VLATKHREIPVKRKCRTENGMSTAVDWRSEIESFAGPFEGNRKSWLSRAARRAGTTSRQIKALYYGEMTDPKFSVAVGVLSASQKAKTEAQELVAIYQSVIGAVDDQNPYLSGKETAALVHVIRALSAVDRA